MTRIATTLAALCAFGLAAGQAPAPPRDPQAAYEPKSAPGAGQVYLARFVGDWDVARTFFPRSGEPARSKGTCRQTMTNRDHFLRSDFVFGPADGASTGQGLIGFEPETERFTSVWVDSRQTRMSFRQSRETFDGKTIVLESKSLDADGKDARRSRTVTTLEGDGRRIHHRQFALGPDGSERLMMELVMTRKPAR